MNYELFLLPLQPISEKTGARTLLFSLTRKVQYQLTFLPLDKMRNYSLLFSLIRKVGRVIDRAGLEIRYTLMGIGGLNPSPSARRSSTSNIVELFFCVLMELLATKIL